MPVCSLLRIRTCEQAFWGTLTVGQEKEEELATTSLQFKFHLQFPVAPRLLTEFSDFSKSVQSGNDGMKPKQTLKNHAKGNDVITNIISASQHFNNFFNTDIQIPEVDVAPLPPAPLAELPGERAHGLNKVAMGKGRGGGSYAFLSLQMSTDTGLEIMS